VLTKNKESTLLFYFERSPTKLDEARNKEKKLSFFIFYLYHKIG